MSTRSRPESRLSHFETVLRSVRTPLGFFTFVSLLLDGVLTGISAATNQIPLICPLIFLFFVVLLVFLIVWFRPHALYHPNDVQVATINLIFPLEETDIDFDLDKCRFEIRDREGRRRIAGVPNLTFGPSGCWCFLLTEIVAQADSVKISLVDHQGRRWEGKPFAPYQTKHELRVKL